MAFWNRDQRQQRKQDRLRAKMRRLQQERDQLAERCRVLEEENRHAGTVLARMRLQAEAALAEVKAKLVKLGVQPEQQEAKRDKRNT